MNGAVFWPRATVRGWRNPAAAGDGRLPALADFAVPALDRLAWDHSDRPIPIVDAHRRTWHGRALSLGDNNRLLMAAPEDELLAQAVHIRSMTLWITLLMIGLAIPGTWWLARHVASELNDLLGESREIRRFGHLDGPQAKARRSGKSTNWPSPCTR